MKVENFISMCEDGKEIEIFLVGNKIFYKSNTAFTS